MHTVIEHMYVYVYSVYTYIMYCIPNHRKYFRYYICENVRTRLGK